MTSSKSHAFRNVPPPPGSKSGTSYTRFIPREELGDFESWKPGSFAGNARAANAAAGGAPASPPAPPPEPSAADWQQRVDAARQAGYQEGYRDGLTALESFKQSFAQQATAQIGALLNALDKQYEELDAQVAQVVLREERSWPTRPAACQVAPSVSWCCSTRTTSVSPYLVSQ